MPPSYSKPSVRSSIPEGFEKAALNQGFNVRVATKAERRENIDYVVWRTEKGEVKDVAAIAVKKTIVRQAKKRKELWGWIEFRDRFGNPGWLFSKCTFLAFKRQKDFLLLSKGDFRRWVESGIIDWTSLAATWWDARYRIFAARAQRKRSPNLN